MARELSFSDLARINRIRNLTERRSRGIASGMTTPAEARAAAEQIEDLPSPRDINVVLQENIQRSRAGGRGYTGRYAQEPGMTPFEKLTESISQAQAPEVEYSAPIFGGGDGNGAGPSGHGVSDTGPYGGSIMGGAVKGTAAQLGLMSDTLAEAVSQYGFEPVMRALPQVALPMTQVNLVNRALGATISNKQTQDAIDSLNADLTQSQRAAIASAVAQSAPNRSALGHLGHGVYGLVSSLADALGFGDLGYSDDSADMAAAAAAAEEGLHSPVGIQALTEDDLTMPVMRSFQATATGQKGQSGNRLGEVDVSFSSGETVGGYDLASEGLPGHKGGQVDWGGDSPGAPSTGIGVGPGRGGTGVHGETPGVSAGSDDPTSQGGPRGGGGGGPGGIGGDTGSSSGPGTHGGPASGSSPGGTGGCFAAGTMILMADNSLKPIENIEVGDVVMSFDEDDVHAELEPNRVTETFVHAENLVLNLNDTTLMTPAHKVYTAENIVKPIGQLNGSILINYEHRPIPCVLKDHNKRITVYNFTVENNHTYIADGYRVHNGKGDAWHNGGLVSDYDSIPNEELRGQRLLENEYVLPQGITSQIGVDALEDLRRGRVSAEDVGRYIRRKARK